MPVYVYVCEKCGKKKELIKKFSEADTPETCDGCKEDDTSAPKLLKRVLFPGSNFELKGRGWYRDGY